MGFYAISELTDRGQVRVFLSNDVNYAAYALGDLEPPYSDHARWYAASQTGNVDGLALIYSALDPQALFLMGDISALSALLLHAIGPDEVFFTARPELEAILRSLYTVEQLSPMFRMRVNKGIFKPLQISDSPDNAVVPIGLDQLGAVQTLIAEAASVDGRDIRDIAFAPDMLKDGFYRGVYRAGRLVAVAGTHLTAPQSRMAAVGNIVVHPDFRRQGQGSRVSHAVTAALIEANYDLIVLNVRQNNQGALKIYRKLGYKQVCPFIEGLAVRC